MTVTVPLGSVATFRKGAGLSKADLAVDGRQKCIHYGELFTKYGAVIASPSSLTHVDLPVRSNSGDVLMPTSDVTPRGLAKASAIMMSDVGLGGDILVIRPDLTRVEPRFLANAIRHEVNQVLALVRGSTVYHLYASDMRNFQLLLPPLAEQIKVADALQEFDELISTLERLIAKKQAIKHGMLQQLLTGRTRLPTFSAPWTEITLGDVAGFRKGSGLPKSALTASGSTPCIHYGELFTFYGPEIIHVASRTNPTGRVVVSEDLDVLMPTSDVTPRGLATASSIHGRGVVLGGDVLIIRPDKARAYGPFLAHAIRRDANQVLQLVRGSTVYHIYAADMQNFTLSIPPVDEQRAIADVLLDAEREIDLLGSRLAKARDLKVGAMQQLLTGRTRLPVEATL